MKQLEFSPTPWITFAIDPKDREWEAMEIMDKNKKCVASHINGFFNACHIVDCVNSHSKLVKQRNDLVEAITDILNEYLENGTISDLLFLSSKRILSSIQNKTTSKGESI